MVGNSLARSALAIMALLAASVALYSLRLYGVLADNWLDVDPGIRAVIARVPIQALAHMLIAPIALFLGPFQFSPALRARYPQAHRWSGRVYVAACATAGTAGLAASPYASGGPVAGLGFGILAVLWVCTTLGAWRAAARRRFALHRLLCQSAFKFDPVSASNFDPFERRGLTVALAASELAGIAETWRARVV